MKTILIVLLTILVNYELIAQTPTPPAPPTITANLTTVCYNDIINLSATSCVNSRLLWYDGSTIANRAKNFNNSIDNYTDFVIVDVYANCLNTTTSQLSAQSNHITVTVKRRPIAPNIISNKSVTISPNTVVNFLAVDYCLNNNDLVTWNTGSNLRDIKVMPDDTTTYSVICTYNGCDSSYPKTIKINVLANSESCSNAPLLIDYYSPAIAGNTSYFFKYNSFDGNQLWQGDANFQNQALVKSMGGFDQGRSDAKSFVNINGTTFFVATGQEGEELWKSDGTTNGTVLVKDINPKLSFSDGVSPLSSAPRFLTNVNGTLYFVVLDSDYYGIWKSDGTANGTVKVTQNLQGIGELISYNGILYFNATNQINGQELWRTDGTLAGTFMVKDMTGSGNPINLQVTNNTLFFSANISEIWKSDGTTASTVMLKKVTGSVLPSNFTKIGNKLFFLATDPTNGTELWTSDGTTAGTLLVKDIFPGNSGSGIYNLTDFNGTVFFQANNGVNGTELWKSDGTSAGTMMVRDLLSGSSNGVIFQPMKVFNNMLFFDGTDGVSGYELWKTDGTASGTILVKDIIPSFGSSAPYQFEVANGFLFFTAEDANGIELWKSDGTSAGTTLVKDIYKGATTSGSTNFYNSNNTLYFVANDGINDREVWTSDGTEVGTKLLKNIRIYYQKDELIKSVTVGNQIFFTLKVDIFNVKLFRSDGTLSGTYMLNDNLKNQYAGAFKLATLNNKLITTTDRGYAGADIWQSDGSIGGTSIIKSFNPQFATGTPPSFLPSEFVTHNGALYFSVYEDTYGHELWKTDGTTIGTTNVKDIVTGFSYNYNGYKVYRGSAPDNLISVNGNLFFTAFSLQNDKELWKTDGSESGTQQVKDIFVGDGYSYSSNPSSLTNMNGILYFVANDGINRNELWKSNGTDAGTMMVKNINTNANAGSDPYGLAVLNNLLIFGANDGSSQRLWKSDGTEAGTVIINPSEYQYGQPLTIVKANNVVYYTINADLTSRKLWKTDGTTAGTKVVSTVLPEQGDINLKVINDHFFFSKINYDNTKSYYIVTPFSPIQINSNPSSPVSGGTPVTFNVTGCSGTVKWLNPYGKGTPKVFTPTVNTTYKANCNPIGCSQSISISLLPCASNYVFSSTNNPTDDISSGTITKSVNATNGNITATNKITGTAKVTYQAKNIQLNAGFKADNGTVFKAEIGGCN